MSRRSAKNNVLINFLLPYPKKALIHFVSPATFCTESKIKRVFCRTQLTLHVHLIQPRVIFVWGYLKTEVFKRRPRNLKPAIREEIIAVRQQK